jgi:hypothetical protein
MVGNGHSKSRLPHHDSYMNLKTLALPILLIIELLGNKIYTGQEILDSSFIYAASR